MLFIVNSRVPGEASGIEVSFENSRDGGFSF
jgi:hypothetical protein